MRSRWNVPHALGGQDGKHITMNKPKKSENEYYTCKGFFSLMLLALEYRFIWVNVGSSGYPSDAQKFNSGRAEEEEQEWQLEAVG